MVLALIPDLQRRKKLWQSSRYCPASIPYASPSIQATRTVGTQPPRAQRKAHPHNHGAAAVHALVHLYAIALRQHPAQLEALEGRGRQRLPHQLAGRCELCAAPQCWESVPPALSAQQISERRGRQVGAARHPSHVQLPLTSALAWPAAQAGPGMFNPLLTDRVAPDADSVSNSSSPEQRPRSSSANSSGRTCPVSACLNARRRRWSSGESARPKPSSAKRIAVLSHSRCRGGPTRTGRFITVRVGGGGGGSSALGAAAGAKGTYRASALSCSARSALPVEECRRGIASV